MKKIKTFDYLLFAGPVEDTLYPIGAYKTKEDAIEAAKSIKAEGMVCKEIIFAPEDDAGTSEVVWSNCVRT